MKPTISSKFISIGAAVVRFILYVCSNNLTIYFYPYLQRSRSSSTSSAAFHLTGIHRWALSGTPLQNRVGELYSLIRYVVKVNRSIACYLYTLHTNRHLAPFFISQMNFKNTDSSELIQWRTIFVARRVLTAKAFITGWSMENARTVVVRKLSTIHISTNTS